MFSAAENFRFWLNIFAGNYLLFIALYIYKAEYRPIRGKRQKHNVILLALVAIIFMAMNRVGSREMDIPGNFSQKYEDKRGIVCDYKREGGRALFVGGSLKMYEGRWLRKFSGIYIPPELRRGDRVEIYYLKHRTMGVITKIGEKEFENDIYEGGRYPVGIPLIVLLLLSMPFYYLWVYKVSPVIDYRLTCAVYTYHDIYIKTMKRVYLSMILTAVVLIIALSGHYETSWDILWGLLLIADYMGVLYLAFLRQKQFIILRDKFFYYNFKKRVEGNVSEIESVEKTDNGMIVRTKEEEMEIFCTSEKYREKLLEKLACKREGDKMASQDDRKEKEEVYVLR